MQKNFERLGGILPALALAAGIGFGAQKAEAAMINFVGFTAGCFGCANPPGPPTSNEAQEITLGGLTYRNSTFDVMTVDGFAGIGADPAVSPALNENNFGSFVLARTPAFTYTNNAFLLRITFTAPPTMIPPTSVIEATLTGRITSTPNGQGIRVDFDNDPIPFTFLGGRGTLVVEDVNINLGNPAAASRAAAVNGFIEVVVPEPSTLALFGMGLVGLGAAVRRRVGIA